MLTDPQKRMYARQILVDELGLAGQERLCTATARLSAAADRAAATVALEYLTRAGLQSAGESLPVLDPALSRESLATAPQLSAAGGVVPLTAASLVSPASAVAPLSAASLVSPVCAVTATQPAPAQNPICAHVDIASSDAVRSLAGDERLVECAAWLAGAFAAVETIKRVAGVGVEGRLDPALTLRASSALDAGRDLEAGRAAAGSNGEVR